MSKDKCYDSIKSYGYSLSAVLILSSYVCFVVQDIMKKNGYSFIPTALVGAAVQFISIAPTFLVVASITANELLENKCFWIR